MKDTAHVARARMGLRPSPDALRWSWRVLVAVEAILGGVRPDDGREALERAVRRLDGYQAAYRRACRIIRAGGFRQA